jgi:hypothetical protein
MDDLDKQYKRTMQLALMFPIVYAIGIVLACGFLAWVTITVMSHFGII